MEPDKISKESKPSRKWSKEEKLAHCKAWQQSGLSRSAFCRQENLSLPTLCSWLKRQGLTKKSSTAMKFIAALRQEPPYKEEQILEVRLTNGLQCRFSRIINVKQICEVIEGLHHVIAD